ncbi:MAG: ATP-binding protein, partial [Magnetovibrio sp.]|nr:ATP-binding protein [Magnetovibrio sp.]
MKRFIPNTMTAQTIAVLIIGLSVSHLLSMMIYSGDRIETLTMMGGRNMAQRIANVSHLISDTPIEWRQKIIAGTSEPGFQVWVTPHSELPNNLQSGWRIDMIRGYLQSQMHGDEAGDIRIQVLDNLPDAVMPMSQGRAGWMHQRMMRAVHGVPAHRSMRVSIQLKDQSWLNFSTVVPEVSSLWSSTSLWSMVAMATAVVLLSIWVVRRLSTPLRTLADASKRLGRDVNAPPLEESGTQEVREATRAFNEMQARLKRLLDNRTEMLAAISHDLRTPITLLRLRIESLDDGEERDRMLLNLSDMEDMIASTLSFARQDGELEERRTVDVSALVQAVTDDFEDAQSNILFEGDDKVLLDCRPMAIKRALTNLIENALKYGEGADIKLNATQTHLVISVQDQGPGIPEEHMLKVFQPFYRVEASRNRETGG